MNAVEQLRALSARLQSLASAPPDPGAIAEPVLRAVARVVPTGRGRVVVIRRTPTGAVMTIAGPGAAGTAAAVRRRLARDAADQIRAAVAAETARRLS